MKIIQIALSLLLGAMWTKTASAYDDGIQVKATFDQDQGEGGLFSPNNGGGDGGRFIVCGAASGRAAALERADAVHLSAFGDGGRCVSVTMPSASAGGLSSRPDVDIVEVDQPRYPVGVAPSLLRGGGGGALNGEASGRAPPRPGGRRRLAADDIPWGIAAVQANNVTMGGRRAVCIIDTGYNLGHEDLPASPPSSTSSGPSTVTGYNGNLPWNQDGFSHGTHVAGTIAALNNGVGVRGVATDNIDLYIVRVFGDDGSWAYSSNLIDAAYRCKDAKANIISMSLGCSSNGGGPFGCSSRAENSAFDDLLNNHGILSIAAAGNDGNTAMSYPASYDSVVSVAAIDSSLAVASFSQKNSQVDLSGPGVAVRSSVSMGTATDASLEVGGALYSTIALDGSKYGTGVTGPLVNCGLGTSTCPNANGAVCLIQRGDVTFAQKTLACQNGGGVAAVIYNNAAGLFSGTLGGTSVNIPSVGISDTDGGELLNLLGTSASVTVNGGNYAYWDGTSMATPHVSGVAALVWSHDTSCTAAQIRDVLQATALDLGNAGRDDAYGFGLVQAKAAVAALHCAGGSTTTPPPPSTTTTTSSCGLKGASCTSNADCCKVCSASKQKCL